MAGAILEAESSWEPSLGSSPVVVNGLLKFAWHRVVGLHIRVGFSL